MKELFQQVRELVLSVELLESQTQLRKIVEQKLENEFTDLQPAVEVCLQELHLNEDSRGIAELIAAHYLIGSFAESLQMTRHSNGTPIVPSNPMLLQLQMLIEGLALPANILSPKVQKAFAILLDVVRQVIVLNVQSEQGATTIEEYEKVMRAKASISHGCLFRILATASEADDSICSSLSTFGDQVGFAVQIWNITAHLWPEMMDIENARNKYMLNREALTYPLLYMTKHEQDLARRILSVIDGLKSEIDSIDIREILEASKVKSLMTWHLVGCRFYSKKVLKPLNTQVSQRLLDWYDKRFLEHLPDDLIQNTLWSISYHEGEKRF